MDLNIQISNFSKTWGSPTFPYRIDGAEDRHLFAEGNFPQSVVAPTLSCFIQPTTQGLIVPASCIELGEHRFSD